MAHTMYMYIERERENILIDITSVGLARLTPIIPYSDPVTVNGD